MIDALLFKIFQPTPFHIEATILVEHTLAFTGGAVAQAEVLEFVGGVFQVSEFVSL